MRLTVIAALLILPAFCANSGTYSVDDAWRQMSQISERSADDYEVIPAQSRSSYDSYGGGGGYNSYGGHGHGGGHGYGGGGGYGHGGGGGYVNQSAVALLGFLYLLNLIQDIIQDLTTTVAPGRKKRSFGDPLHEWLADIGGQGGVHSLTYEVASTILPLVSEFTDHNDKVRPKSCVQRSICSANWRLTSNYGQMGKIFARLSSEAVFEHFAIANDKSFAQAATDGRNLVNCYTVYNECKSDD